MLVGGCTYKYPNKDIALVLLLVAKVMGVCIGKDCRSQDLGPLDIHRGVRDRLKKSVKSPQVLVPEPLNIWGHPDPLHFYRKLRDLFSLFFKKSCV